MSRRPLFWSAAAFAAGASFPHDAQAGAWLQFAAASLCGALAMAAASSTSAGLRSGLALLLAGFFATGRVAVHAAGEDPPGSLGAWITRHPDRFHQGIDLSGRLARGSETSGKSLHLLIDVERVRLGARPVPATGRLLLRLPRDAAPSPDVQHARRGDAVEAFVRMGAPRRYANPGSFDYPLYLRARGVVALGSIKTLRLLRIEPLEGPPAGLSLLRGADALRSGLLSRIRHSFPETDSGRRAAAVSEALLLGRRDAMTSEDLLLLQVSGLSHLLAVSGFNEAVLAAMIFLTFRAAGVRPRGAALSVLPVLALYLLVNSEESSVARAVIMATVFLSGRLLWRRPDPLASLGASALVILWSSPLQIHDPGFQLTFAATLGLMVLARSGRSAGRRERKQRRLARGLWNAVIVTLAATVATTPLSAMRFDRVAPGALPANLLAGPLMAAAFVGVVSLEAIGTIWPEGARVVARGVTWLIDATFLVASLIAETPGMSYRRPPPDVWLVSIYYAALTATTALAGRSRRRGLACVCGAVWIVAACCVVRPVDSRGTARGLRLTAIDVGQGEALLLETPEGGRLLIDAGGSALGAFDVGDRVVGPALRRLGLNSLDAIALTHPDVDHAGGAASIVRDFDPEEIWLPRGAARWREREAVENLLRAARRSGARVRMLGKDDSIDWKGTRIRVLHPPGAGAPGPTGGNEDSLVLLVEGGGRSVLLAGDAGRATETSLGDAVPLVDLLKVGHHGSRSATSNSFLRRAGPKVAIISCGRENPFGHPHPDVLDRLAASGARVCRTDRHGAITIELDPEGTRLPESCALDRTSRAPGRGTGGG